MVRRMLANLPKLVSGEGQADVLSKGGKKYIAATHEWHVQCPLTLLTRCVLVRPMTSLPSSTVAGRTGEWLAGILPLLPLCASGILISNVLDATSLSLSSRMLSSQYSWWSGFGPLSTTCVGSPFSKDPGDTHHWDL